MSTRVHMRLFLVGTLAWILFWVLGLPSYYQQYRTEPMIVFCLGVAMALAFVFMRVLRQVRPERRTSLGLWMAFYFSIPLAIYDWLYCGLFLGHGWRFLSQYWYLTAFYLLPWPALPLIAFLLNRRAARPTQPLPLARAQ